MDSKSRLNLKINKSESKVLADQKRKGQTVSRMIVVIKHQIWMKELGKIQSYLLIR